MGTNNCLGAAAWLLWAGYFGGVIIASVSLVLLTMIPESPMFMLLHEDLYSREQVLGGMR